MLLPYKGTEVFSYFANHVILITEKATDTRFLGVSFARENSMKKSITPKLRSILE